MQGEIAAKLRTVVSEGEEIAVLMLGRAIVVSCPEPRPQHESYGHIGVGARLDPDAAAALLEAAVRPAGAPPHRFRTLGLLAHGEVRRGRWYDAGAPAEFVETYLTTHGDSGAMSAVPASAGVTHFQVPRE